MSQENNKVTIPPAGFRVNPQNINLNGRPKKKFSISRAMDKVAQEKDPATKIARYKRIIKKAFSMAEMGDSDMIKYILNRLEPETASSDGDKILVVPILGGRSITKCPKCGEDIS